MTSHTFDRTLTTLADCSKPLERHTHLTRLITLLRRIGGPERPFIWIMVWAVLVHLSWSLALLFDTGTAPLIVLIGLHWAYGLPEIVLGGLLLGITLMAGASLWLGHKLPNRLGLALVLPQQFVLILALVSDAQTTITGVIPGAVPSAQPIDRVLLLLILFPVMVAAVLHTGALIERHSAWARHT